MSGSCLAGDSRAQINPPFALQDLLTDCKLPDSINYNEEVKGTIFDNLRPQLEQHKIDTTMFQYLKNLDPELMYGINPDQQNNADKSLKSKLWLMPGSLDVRIVAQQLHDAQRRQANVPDRLTVAYAARQ